MTKVKMRASDFTFPAIARLDTKKNAYSSKTFIDQKPDAFFITWCSSNLARITTRRVKITKKAKMFLFWSVGEIKIRFVGITVNCFIAVRLEEAPKWEIISAHSSKINFTLWVINSSTIFVFTNNHLVVVSASLHAIGTARSATWRIKILTENNFSLVCFS